MRKMKPFVAALGLMLLLPGVVFGAKKWEKIKSPKMREIVVPEVQRESLDNGLQLFILEDHELPLFRMTLVIKGGGAYNPDDKLGLAGITAEVLRSGGSEALSGDELDELLESSGASIETSSDDLTTTISVNVLIEDTEKALQIVRDLLLKPAYPEDKLDLALTQSRSAISRRNDDPMGIADREFMKLLHGKDHPFAQQIEYEHLANITRADLLAFHRKYFHPTNTSIALWGDFDKNEIVARVRNTLGTWPTKTVDYPQIPDIPKMGRSVNLAVKESVNQSNIRLGHRSIRMDHPDYHALVVMNEILGGGLGARLFNEVRSRQGLAYRVGSGLGANLEYPGMFQVVCGTKSESTIKAIRSCIEQVRKMKTEPVTDEELTRAKDGLLNSHVFRFANKGAIVNRQMRYVRNGYPTDFIEKFAQGVDKVTAEDIQRAAANFLDPDNFVLMVVGKPDDFDEPLNVLGEVNEVDISIPEPPASEFPEATAETLAKGKKILARAADAVGGLKALAKVSDLTENSDVQLSMMGQQIGAKLTRYMKYPGSMRVEISVMGQNMVQVYNGETHSGYVKSPQGRKDLDGNELQEFKDELALDLINFLRDFEAYQPQYLEDTTVDGKEAMVVAMTPPDGGKRFKIYVDSKSNYVIKVDNQSKNFQGAPVSAETYLSDYRSVGGIQLPHVQTVHHDGEPFMDVKTTGFSVTDVIPDDKFVKSE